MNELDAMSEALDAEPLLLKMLIVVGLKGTLAVAACWANSDYWSKVYEEYDTIRPHELGIQNVPKVPGIYVWVGTLVVEYTPCGWEDQYEGHWVRPDPFTMKRYLKGQPPFDEGWPLHE